MADLPIKFNDNEEDEQVNQVERIDLPEGPSLLASFFFAGPKKTFTPIPNIADMFDTDTLMKVGQQVVNGFHADEGSMTEWSEFVDKGLELVKQENESRNEPWDGAANFKSPTLMNAALKFSDRASTELLRQRDIVKTEIIGKDDDEEKQKRANRVSEFSNYQINIEMAEWREEHDKLLYDLPYVGTVFKKSFFDARLGRNVSELITYPNFAVNQGAKSVERLRRFTEVFDLTENEITERQRQGIWLDVNLSAGVDDDSENAQESDTDKFSTFLEQQGYFDLDRDGYEEPYTFVVHKSSGTVVRMMPRFEPQDVLIKDEVNKRAAKLSDLMGSNGNLPEISGEREVIRITPDNNITKYGFLRDPQGGFLDVGYSHLLGSLTAAINTTTNQLIDAGTLANVQGGWLARGFRRKVGDTRFNPGEWKQTGLTAQDMQNGIMPLPVKEASPTLFNMMQLMVANSQELSASADLTSALGANAPATTTLALIQEQQQSAGAIILRIYRAMANEFKKLFILNSKFLDPVEYQEVVDDEEANFEADFNLRDMDIVPVANPEISSKIQRVQQAQTEISQLDAVAAAGGDIVPIVKNFFEAIGSSNVDEIFPELTPEQQLQDLLAKNPQLAELVLGEKERLDAQLATQLDQVEQQEERADAETASKIDKEASEVEKNQSITILNLEKAETEDVNNQISTYSAAGQIDNQQLQNEQALQQLQQPQELNNGANQTRPNRVEE